MTMLDNIPYTNPLEVQNGYSLPQGRQRLYPQRYKGIIETYLVASRWKSRDLEEIFSSMKCMKWNNYEEIEQLQKITKLRNRSGMGAIRERIVFWHN